MPTVSSRRAKGAEREQLVVVAAAQVIAEQGLANLRVSDIAERAGMTVGHVTYYFPSKNDLLIRAIQHSERLFHRDVEARLARHKDPWARLRELIEAASATGQGDQGWVLWFQVWSMAASDASVAQAQQELAEWWRLKLAEVVQYGVDEREFAPNHVADAVAVISALTNGLSVQLALGDPTLSAERIVDTVLDIARSLLSAR